VALTINLMFVAAASQVLECLQRRTSSKTRGAATLSILARAFRKSIPICGAPLRLGARLQIFWVIDRLVPDADNLDRIALGKILDIQAASDLAMRPR
jgi:hypothetical protein